MRYHRSTMRTTSLIIQVMRCYISQSLIIIPQLHRRAIDNRISLFLEKLKAIYILMCEILNIKHGHTKLKRIPMTTMWELRTDPKAVGYR